MTGVPASSRGGPPSGAAGGDLTGTFPNPSIAPAVVTAAKMSSGAAALSTVATADGAGGTSYAPAPTGVISSSVVDITSAQIKALFTSPVQLVAAPGAGFFVVPIFVAAQYKFGTLVYVDPDGDTQVVYAGSSTAVIEFASIISAAVSTVFYTSASIGPGIAQTAAANKAINIRTPATNPTLGDGTLRITTYYATFTLA